MKTTLGLICAMVSLSGCVGTDLLSSAAPSHGQFGYPAAALAPAAPATSAIEERPLAPAAAGMATDIPAPATAATGPAAIPTLAMAGPNEAVYDESRDPVIASLLAKESQSGDMPDLAQHADGRLRLPDSPRLQIIDVSETRASLTPSN